MSDNTVSIVLPTHNGSRYIRTSIDSCLRQTYRAIELIVVDDASTDDTLSIIRSYTDPRLRVIVHPVNKRTPEALNTGLSAATGAYLTWTSDDNYFADTAIATMAAYLDAHPRVGFVYSNYTWIDESGAVIKPISAEEPQELVYTSALGACFMYRRIVHETVGPYRDHFFLCEDYDYWLRVRRRFRMKKIPDYLYFYRVHPGSLSRQRSDEQQRIKRIVQEQNWAWEDKYYYRCFDAYAHGDHRAARRWAAVAFLMNPFNRSALRILLLTTLPPTIARGIRAACAWGRNILRHRT